MLTKLIPVDDLPLKLGRKMPTAAEKAKSIAQMEACAKVLDNLDEPVQWVRDDRTPLSDFDHPAADMDDPMVIVASEFEKMYEGFVKAKHWIALGGLIAARAPDVYADGNPAMAWAAYNAGAGGIPDYLRISTASMLQQSAPRALCCGVAEGSFHHPQCREVFQKNLAGEWQ